MTTTLDQIRENIAALQDDIQHLRQQLEIRENIAVLQDDILHLEQQLDALDPDSPSARSKDRILNVKWRLLSEQRALLERHESEAPRRTGSAGAAAPQDADGRVLR